MFKLVDYVCYSWILLLAGKSIAHELANSCGSPRRFVITSIRHQLVKSPLTSRVNSLNLRTRKGLKDT
jgi:hypothetical protein